MNWKQLQSLHNEKEFLSDKYFELLSTSDFAKQLDKLCLVSDNYCCDSVRLERYEELNPCDNNTIQSLKEELLQSQVEFYNAFIDIVEKFDYVSKYFYHKEDSTND